MLLVTSLSQSSPLVLTPLSFLITYLQFWKISALLCIHTFWGFNISVPGYLCNYLYNVANLHALTIIPTGHTRVTSSCATTIDLMLTTSPELVKNCQTIPPIGTSDHNGIISVVSLLTHTVASQPSRKIWRYNHANFSLANELLSNLNPSHILVDGDPSTSWNNWCNAFLDVMHKCIPS